MDLIPRKIFTNEIFDEFFLSKESNMKCDIYEKDGNYHIEMDVPGFNKDEIKIEVSKDYLTITSEKTDEVNNDENKNYIHKERTYGKYQRSFHLRDLDSSNINAEFSNGVLKIVVPKKEKQTNKKYIEIK